MIRIALAHSKVARGPLRRACERGAGRSTPFYVSRCVTDTSGTHLSIVSMSSLNAVTGSAPTLGRVSPVCYGTECSLACAGDGGRLGGGSLSTVPGQRQVRGPGAGGHCRGRADWSVRDALCMRYSVNRYVWIPKRHRAAHLAAPGKSAGEDVGQAASLCVSGSPRKTACPPSANDRARIGLLRGLVDRIVEKQSGPFRWNGPEVAVRGSM